MRWRWFLASLALLPAALGARAATAPQAANAGPAGTWERYDDDGGCIGGNRCGDQGDALRIPLEDAPISAIRFHARDDVGESAAGRLRVRIDAIAVAPEINVADSGELYELPVPGRRGRFLILEASADDEVVVEDIEVRYTALRGPRERREWKAYPDRSACIGGGRCRDQGNTLRIRLEDAPVWGVRFLAHDDVGERHRGHLRVRIDRRSLSRDIDVFKSGETYSLLVEGLRGRWLVFEALTAEEIVVEEIEVQYSGLRDPLGP